jgi:hypothetical protein
MLDRIAGNGVRSIMSPPLPLSPPLQEKFPMTVSLTTIPALMSAVDRLEAEARVVRGGISSAFAIGRYLTRSIQSEKVNVQENRELRVHQLPPRRFLQTSSQTLLAIVLVSAA